MTKPENQTERHKRASEIRELRLESLHMRMRSYRKAGFYQEALTDAKKIW